MVGRVVPRLKPASALCFALLLVGTLLAGCIDEPALEVATPDEPMADPLDRDGRDLRTDLKADDEVDAPDWQLGQWFGVHVYFMDAEFEDDWHFDVVVVDDAGDRYRTATPNEEVAKEHAMWDYPGLGDVQKSNLGFTGIGASWDWMYDFPLSDGKTWTREVTLIDFTGGVDTASVTFTTSYAASIVTTEGNRPGFQIEGRFDDGGLFIEYDFVPAVGWFAHMWMYEDQDDPIVHIMSMGFGEDWTGTYWVYEAETVLEHIQFLGVDPEEPELFLESAPFTSFAVADDADFVAGFMFAGAFGGAQTLFLIDPEGEVRETILLGVPEPDFTFEFFEVPAVGGDWHLASLGAGVFSISFMQLWQLWGSEHTL